MTDPRRSRASVLQFAGWAFAGVLLPAGLAAAFTPLILVAAPVCAVVVILLCRRGVNASIAGLAVGAAVVPLVIGYLNREGPGTVCHTIGRGGQECAQEWSPWPFWAAGTVLLLAGPLIYLWLRRRRFL